MDEYVKCDKSTVELIDFLADLAAGNLMSGPQAAHPMGMGKALGFVESLRRECKSELGYSPKK